MNANIKTGDTQINASIPADARMYNNDYNNSEVDMGRDVMMGNGAPDNNYGGGYGRSYGRGPNGDYNTSMGYASNDYDSAMDGLMGAFWIFTLVFYAVIFFLLPFYMIAVTDASVKRKYWWILGMIVPVVNFICIPIYYFTKLEKLPKEHHVSHPSHTHTA